MKQRIFLCAGMLFVLGSAMSARADYVFNFNSLTPSTSSQSNAIATYMDGVIGCANCVTVSSGVAVAQKYNGDNHVVGPGGTAATLGDTENATNNSGPVGGWDSYISNTAADSNGNNPNQLSTQIVITISAQYAFTGTFSFDYEIFPDGSCADLTSWHGVDCGGVGNPNTPDLDFVANGSTPVNHDFLAVAPGTTNGTSTDSVASPGTNKELAPQYIGTSGNYTLTNATQISFIDWPATIGVDNLKLVTATPEPSGYAFILGGLMLALLVGSKVRQGLAKSSN